MKTKRLIVAVLASLLAVGAFAQDAKPQFKWYGFFRNYFTFDTRESTAGVEDFYYFMPKDVNYGLNGEDLNEGCSFRFAALTTRLGLDVTGYQYDGYDIGAKIETDFYSGVSGTTGAATLRLRQAYVTLAKGARSWKIGQAWHPMAADMPDIFSLETGAPFGPFSRTPLVNFDYAASDAVTLSASAMWQMQYTSTGPEGNSADYLKYGMIPELYLGVSYKSGNALLRAGVDVLSIKPRRLDSTGSFKVSDRLTTFTVFQFGQFKAGDFTIKEKLTFANDGSHMNMVGGYGVTAINSDGSWEYGATRNLSGWASLQYKKGGSRWVPSVFFGYTKNLGVAEPVLGGFWCKNSANSLGQLFRIQPEVLYNLGNVQFGLEYMFTDAEYGSADEFKEVVNNLHWAYNNRIQMMVKYTF